MRMTLESHHREGGGFRNPWPGARPHGLTGVLKWAMTRRQTRESAQPHLLLPEPDSDAPHLNGNDERVGVSSPPADALTVTWIGHSTFLIQCNGLNILTDPIWSARASPVSFVGPIRVAPPGLSFDSMPEIHATLLSHDHYDHLDDPTVCALIRRFPRMRWLVPLGVRPFVEKRGARSVVELDWWEERNVGAFAALCTPAQHFSGRFPWNRDATLWCGWAVRIGDFRIFFAGDTGLHGEFTSIAHRFGPFDAAILPIGAYAPRWFMQPVHMDPTESVAAFRELVSLSPDHRCVMIASHWGTFRLTDEPLGEPPRVARQAWSTTGLAPDLLAILTHGETRVIAR